MQPTFENYYWRVKNTPAVMAIWVEGESVTFAELHQRVLDLAARLHATRIEQGLSGPMPILAERSLASAIAIFSAYYAGVPFTVIDEQTPLEYAHGILEKLSISHPIWQPDTSSSNSVPLLQLSQNHAEVPDFDPHLFAYAIMTSGSAGTPKAVMHSRNTGLDARLPRFPNPLDNHYSMFATTPFAFAVGLANLLFVSQGHSCYSLKPANHTPSAFFAFIRELEPTNLFLPSQMARIYSKTVADPKITTIRQIQVGGEALRFEHLRGFAQSFTPDTEFYHRLGSSESICGWGWKGTIDDMASSGQLTLTPQGNDYLLFKREDIGENLFELYSGGGVALGYYANPEMTRERFVTLENRQWWKSGDLLQKVGEDTYLHYGRIDDVVKISGHLVSPQSVARALMSLPDIAVASVTSEREIDRYILHAYVEKQESSVLDVESIRRDLAELIPTYMIPQNIYIVDKIPLTSRGKTDKSTLQAHQRQA
jgi:acyl-coenzyme A synthetase/AMP-(fatty) acid ligase